MTMLPHRRAQAPGARPEQLPVQDGWHLRRAAGSRVVKVLVAAAFGLAITGAARAQPNIVLIATDDQRHNTLHAMPTVRAELVGKGVRFRNAFVVNPLCCPSRASILTGTYSHTNGVWANGGAFGGFQAFDDSATLPLWLDAVGYETMFVGKYLNGYTSTHATPDYVPPGWDRWLAYWGRPRYFDYELTDGRTVTSYGASAREYSTDVMGAAASRLIRETEGPFFLYFSPFAPHLADWPVDPYSVDPAPRHVDAFAGLGALERPSVNEPDVADKPRHVRARAPIPPRSLAELREEQLESLLAVDDAIAGILAALEDTGKLADTMIVFTSDNGHAWGEHRWTHKSDPYEESLRVPLVVRYDRLGVAPRTEGRFALNVDLAPTLADAAGIEVTGVEGRSLVGLLAGGPTAWRTRFLIEYFSPGDVPGYCGFRGRRWKYVQYATGEEELYDLGRDPNELRNLRAEDSRWSLTMEFRARVQQSQCRPPGFGRPLPLCTRSGTSGRDSMRGTERPDWLCAGRGNDRIDVSGGRQDVVRCGAGFDRVRAGRRDVVFGCEARIP
ncbi:MAG TPA: sulfatase [Gaiellaceae bacterium]|nr:sulfatase [Gaiellaceae bacterium]